MAKSNMFDLLQERKDEQDVLEARLTGGIAQSEREQILRGRPRKRPEATTMTISIDKSDKVRIKRYAASRRLSVSDLIHQWIENHCEE